MGIHEKSLSEVFGGKVPHPPEPMEIDEEHTCPFLQSECEKKAGIDDSRLRPSGACSIWLDFNFAKPKEEKSIIICPKRFYASNYFHLWSLTEKMISEPLDQLILIPEVKDIDWVIYSRKNGVVGAIEVQSLDTTGSYKPQLIFLRNIDDSEAQQYPDKVNCNWANATYKRFYPQVAQTISSMKAFDAPVGLLTQDLVKPYLEAKDRFPECDGREDDPEVVWLLLNNDAVVGKNEVMEEEFLYITKESMVDVLLNPTHPTAGEIMEASQRQINSGRAVSPGDYAS